MRTYFYPSICKQSPQLNESHLGITLKILPALQLPDLLLINRFKKIRTRIRESSELWWRHSQRNLQPAAAAALRDTEPKTFTQSDGFWWNVGSQRRRSSGHCNWLRGHLTHSQSDITVGLWQNEWSEVDQRRSRSWLEGKRGEFKRYCKNRLKLLFYIVYYWITYLCIRLTPNNKSSSSSVVWIIAHTVYSQQTLGRAAFTLLWLIEGSKSMQQSKRYPLFYSTNSPSLLKPTLPTMHVFPLQLCGRLWCVMFVAANVAWSLWPDLQQRRAAGCRALVS